MAADDAKKKSKKGKRPVAGQRQLNAAFSAPKGIELSADQQAKIAEIKKAYSSKLSAAFTKFSGSLSAEQKKSRADAFKAAKESGTKGKEQKKAIAAALKLTDEQKASQKAIGTLRKEIRGKVLAVLTAEQKEKAGIKSRGAKKKGAKKNAKKKKEAK